MRKNRSGRLILCSLVLGLLAFPPTSFADDSPFYNFGSEDEITALNKRIEEAIAKGRYSEALPLAEKAAVSAATSFGRDHEEYAKALNNLGWSQQTAGDYKAARSSFESALEIYKAKYGEDSPRLATTLNNLAVLLCFQGDFDTALPLLQRVLTSQVLVMGTSNPELVYTLNNIAAVQNSLGHEEDSRKTLERALALPKVTDVVARSQTLNNLSMIAQNRRNLKGAQEYLQQAVDLRRASSTGAQPDMIELLNNLALIKFSLGDPSSAKSLLSQALEIAKTALGEQHIDCATTLSNLASIDYQTGDKSAARTAFLKVADAIDRHVENVLPAMSFAEQRAFLSRKIPNSVSYLVSSCKDAEDVAQVYNHLFRWKGLLIETLRWQAALTQLSTASSQSAELAELMLTRKELGALFNRTGGGADWEERFDKLSRRKADLERTLLSSQSGRKTSDVLSDLTLKQFLGLLKEDECLVDLYRYDDIGANKTPKYGAFVADSTGAVRFIDLGSASEIDLQIEGWRDLVVAKKSSDLEANSLKKLLFAKLNVTKPKLFLSPDGDLARFPLNIYSVNAAGDQQVAQLDAPRELCYLRAGTQAGTQATTQATTNGDRKMLVVGGVDFGKGTPLLKFPSLPGTVREAGMVIDIARKDGIRCRYLDGNNATKTRVIESIKEADLAHLATHGIFSDAGFAQLERQMNSDVGNSKEAERNPLLSSSLVLAAAKPEDEQPEMLSAEEFPSTDLRRCKLIVLSACETGLGKSETGQGIMGLRASMMAAGARTLIMSLWKVPDFPTTMLMQEFYENLLTKKQSPATALKNAQNTIRATSPALALPVNWAAWVLVGDGW